MTCDAARLIPPWIRPLRCERTPGHDGPHMRREGDGAVLIAWPANEPFITATSLDDQSLGAWLARESERAGLRLVLGTQDPPKELSPGEVAHYVMDVEAPDDPTLPLPGSIGQIILPGTTDRPTTQRNAAILAMGHLEAAAGYLDMLSGEAGIDWPGEDPLLYGDDPGTEALALASTVRKALTGSRL